MKGIISSKRAEGLSGIGTTGKIILVVVVVVLVALFIFRANILGLLRTLPYSDYEEEDVVLDNINIPLTKVNKAGIQITFLPKDNVQAVIWSTYRVTPGWYVIDASTKNIISTNNENVPEQFRMNEEMQRNVFEGLKKVIYGLDKFTLVSDLIDGDYKSVAVKIIPEGENPTYSHVDLVDVYKPEDGQVDSKEEKEEMFVAVVDAYLKEYRLPEYNIKKNPLEPNQLYGNDNFEGRFFFEDEELPIRLYKGDINAGEINSQGVFVSTFVGTLNSQTKKIEINDAVFTNPDSLPIKFSQGVIAHLQELNGKTIDELVKEGEIPQSYLGVNVFPTIDLT